MNSHFRLLSFAGVLFLFVNSHSPLPMFGKMFLPRYGASFLLLMMFLFAECHGVVESAGGDIKLAATREEMVRELQVMVPVMMMKISKVLRAARLGTNFLSCFVGDGANVL